MTIQSTGIGGPSAAAVISDLAAEGVRRIVRLGTCVATVKKALEPGSVVQVDRVLGLDGVAVGWASQAVLPDPDLNALLKASAGPPDLQPQPACAKRQVHNSYSGEDGHDEPLLARDLQTTATFAVAADLYESRPRRLIVSEDEKGVRLEETELEPEFLELGPLVLDRIAPAKRLQLTLDLWLRVRFSSSCGCPTSHRGFAGKRFASGSAKASFRSDICRFRRRMSSSCRSSQVLGLLRRSERTRSRR